MEAIERNPQGKPARRRCPMLAEVYDRLPTRPPAARHIVSENERVKHPSRPAKRNLRQMGTCSPPIAACASIMKSARGADFG